MAIIRPFQTVMFTCAECEQTLEVIIFDGVNNWDMKFNMDIFDGQDDTIVSVARVTMKSAETFMGFAAHDGIHVAHRLVLWAENSEVFDRLVYLANHPEELLAEGEEVEEADDDEATTTTRH
jgi:hypothetical protein